MTMKFIMNKYKIGNNDIEVILSLLNETFNNPEMKQNAKEYF